MNDRTPPLTGIRIQILDFFFIAITALVFFVMLILSSKVSKGFYAVKDANKKFIICEQSSKLIEEASSFLTEQARLFVVTNNEEYAKAYLKEINETKRQQKALEALKEVCTEKDLALQRLTVTLAQSESLINLELYSIRLAYKTIGATTTTMPKEIAAIKIKELDENLPIAALRETALNSLFGDGYLLYKKRITENCKITIQAIEQQIQLEMSGNGEKLGKNILRLRILVFTLLLVTVLIFMAFACLILYPLKKFKEAIDKDEKLNIIGSLEFKLLAQSYNEIYNIKAQNEKSLLEKAEYDALTGLLNRRAFDQICKTSAKKSEPIALLLIDLDNFKYINDTYGHTGGDTALQELARILLETFRTSDYITRIGGDEFAAILPNCTPDVGNSIKRKILSVNEKLTKIKDNISPVSVSVGIAFSANGFTDELFKNADKALYIVKEQGKRGCVIYEENYATKK